MPNGISCAVFAARNHIYGKQEQNIFKEGIAHAQTARAIDSVTKTGAISGPIGTPITNFFSKAASIARKLLYPLIIGSAVYNTAKSDDKVKTGFSQGSGIVSMLAFEKVAKKLLEKANTQLLKYEPIQNNKYLKSSLYVLKGLAFVGASLMGYNLGSSTTEKIVDKIREKAPESTSNDNPFSESTETKEMERILFEDMIL